MRFAPGLHVVQAELLPYMREVVQLGKDATIVASVFQILELVSQTKGVKLPAVPSSKVREFNFSLLRDRFSASDAAGITLIKNILSQYQNIL